MWCTTPQSAQPTAPLKGKAAAAAHEGAVRAERMNPFPTKFVAAAAAIELHLIRRKRHLPLKGKAITAAHEGAVRAERMNPFPTNFVAAAAAIELHLIRRKRHLPLKGKAAVTAAAIESHLIRRKRHLPLKGKAMTYLRHVSGAKRTSMGKISRRPRNMSKHRTALLIILSPETPMVKVFESMP